MSADNGYLVTYLRDKTDEYGIFYYGSGEYEDDHYVGKNAVEIFDDPVKAIVRAHIIENRSTEYGVSVTQFIIEKAAKQLSL
jgi:hypothetical protein